MERITLLFWTTNWFIGDNVENRSIAKTYLFLCSVFLDKIYCVNKATCFDLSHFHSQWPNEPSLCALIQLRLPGSGREWRWSWFQSQYRSTSQCLWTCTPSTRPSHWRCPCPYVSSEFQSRLSAPVTLLSRTFSSVLAASGPLSGSSAGEERSRRGRAVGAAGQAERRVCFRCRWGESVHVTK